MTPARLSLRAADRETVSKDRVELVTGSEHHLPCPVCGCESLVVRAERGKVAVFCERLCSFAAIRDSFRPHLRADTGNLVEAKPVVRLYRSGISPNQTVVFRSIHAASIERRLYIREHRLPAEFEERYATNWEKWKRETDQRFDHGSDAALKIPIGFAPVIRELLEEQELTAEFFPRSQSRLERPEEGDYAPGIARFLYFVRNQPRGVIRVAASSIRAARLPLSISEAWPDQRVLVVVRSHRHAISLEEELSSRCSSVGLITRHVQTNLAASLLVVEANWINSRAADLEKADTVLLLDATLLTRQYVYDPLLCCSTARLYGLLPVGMELRPFEEDRIASLLGFSSMTLLSHSQIDDGRIKVRTVENSCGVDLSRASTLGDVKRWGIWRNAGRNRFVAMTARRLLADLGADREELAHENAPTWLVGVLVENEEHVARLAPLLPGWLIPCQDVRDAEPKYDQPGEDLPQGVRGVIVTMLTRNLPRLAGLVRADGGQGLVLDPNSVNVNILDGVQIIDIADRHHPRLKRWASSRVEAYRRAGCFVNGIAEEHDALRRFLKTHPPLQAQ